MSTTNNSFVAFSNTDGREKYIGALTQIMKDGVCPFCPEQLAKYHKNPILQEGTFWLVTESMYPYKGAKPHLLLIHKNHISTLEELVPEAWTEFYSLVKELIKKHSIKGGTTFIRFGDIKYTGASVSHLHGHIVSSDPDSSDYAPVVTRIA